MARRGLSPRVRGNQVLTGNPVAFPRSIPACTGEPIGFRLKSEGPEVYPRVYGGTRSSLFSIVTFNGLSPRVRGNPKERISYFLGDGSIPACTGEPKHLKRDGFPMRSIPACTGEPWPIWALVMLLTVYPRVYGGTKGCLRIWRPCPGSIPACTGEPAAFDAALVAVKVYPRVYGGTMS